MLKRRLTLFMLGFVVMCTLGCKKKTQETPNSPDEESLIKDYITNFNPNAIRDASGIYFEIVRPGTGEEATIESSVVLNYTAAILNGNQFESRSNTSYRLKNVIRAWQVGILKLRPGGKILIYVPSAMAYGANSPKLGIPTNATLVFDIELIGYLK